ncbi:phage antirepressor [Solibacillus silvestris]|uniref:phage antirepressor n=1 Tax=Solibacillus silvestris TaxID=76853 RepID=UPI003F80B90E
MSELKMFEHPMFGELPIFTIEGIEWFGATEAAKALTFSNPYKAVDNHVDQEDCTVHTVLTKGGKQPKKFINESGLYNLIFGAANQGNSPEIKEQAKKFKRWVTSEVLPTIRKTGGYVQENRAIDFVDVWLPQLDDHTKQAVASTLETNRKLLTENDSLKSAIKQLKPKADYTDTILKNKGLVTIGQISKDYGMSATKMNELLNVLKVQYKQSGQWLLYAKHQAKGYTHSDTINITRSDGSPDVRMNTKWTQVGRLFIYELLKENDILPMIEREFKQVK